MNFPNPSHGQQIIRVLLAHLPQPILLPFIKELQTQPHVDVVSSVDNDVQLLAWATHRVDMVVLGTRCASPPPGIVSHLLTHVPSLRIIVVQVQNDHVIEYWLGLRQHQSQVGSIRHLVNLIRHLSERDIME